MKLPSLHQNNFGFFLIGIAVAAIAITVILWWQQHKLAQPVQTEPQPASANTQPKQVLPNSSPPSAPGKDQLVLELFNPSDQSLTHQLNKTNISQQIEQAITINFILGKCGKLSANEYRDTFRALIFYAEKTHLAEDPATAEKLVRHISESSGVSYSLIYSRLSCTSPQLPELANQLRSWTKSIMTPSL